MLGSAGGPRHAAPLIAGRTFVMVNGDTLTNFALAPLLEAHARSGADVTMAVVPNTDPERYNGIRANAAGVVSGFVPKGQAMGTWHFVGVQVVEKALFDRLADGVPAETVAGLYRDIVATEPGRIRVHRVEGEFIDVGTPADYLQTCLTLASVGEMNATTERHLPGAHVDRVRRTVVWHEATVPASASLTRAIVAGRVVVPDNFSATDAIVVPAAVARPGDQAMVQDGLAIFPLH